jgi:HK97 family phage major capsid protein
MKLKLKENRTARAAAFGKFKALANKPEDLTSEETAEYTSLKAQIEALDVKAKQIREAQDLEAGSGEVVSDDEALGGKPKVKATVKDDRYEKDITLISAACAKMIGVGGNVYGARTAALEIYGENHPVTKALMVSTGPAGGFLVPPDQAAEIIELLRPKAVVRAAGPRTMGMPRGTMTLPSQASAATATYGSETSAIPSSEQSFASIVASYKKLTALVPITNDMMRYAEPSMDAFIRDDIVKVLALRQDLAFLVGTGALDTPRGMLSFANSYTVSLGGTAGNFVIGAASVMAGTNVGNFITSTYSYTLSTVAQELGAMVNKLDTADVPDYKRAWFMHPRSWNYLNNVQNSLGVYVYRAELSTGKLMGYPVYKTTQISIAYGDASGHTDCSFVFLTEMDDAMILDSMQLELAVSSEASYVDSGGNTVNAFQKDQKLIRAIAEHDFQMRHNQSIAVLQGVAWSPG